MPGRPPGTPRALDWQKEFNTQINKIRYVIEQAIANFKTWRIMHTDYRRPWRHFRKPSQLRWQGPGKVVG